MKREDIKVGARFTIPARKAGKGYSPLRVHEIYKIENRFLIRCYVDPPLSGGRKTNFLSEGTILREGTLL